MVVESSISQKKKEVKDKYKTANYFVYDTH